MTKKIKWKANKRLRIGNWDLSDSGDILHEIDLAWANVLGVPKLMPDLQFQYFSTVKTDIFADEVAEEEV
jgi:hypothetical protein